MALTEADIALQLFLSWLDQNGGLRWRLAQRSQAVALARGDGCDVAIYVATLIESADEAWLAARALLQERLTAAVPGSYALWVPPGAPLPTDEVVVGELVERVGTTALRLNPGERSFVAIPTKLYLRKVAAEGNVITVAGGLSQHWARFTERVRGTYDLDSTRLHRLPESDAHLEALLDAIVVQAARLTPGTWVPIDTVDAWTVQRLEGASGFIVVGLPPGEAAEMGLAVRRNLRRVLSQAGPILRAQEGELRAIVLVGPYARIDQEGASTALRGYDPSLYAGIDFVCLVADGLIKPIIQAPASSFSQRPV